MARGLREFQEYLGARLAAGDKAPTAGLLGFTAAGEHWLVDLVDAGAVVPGAALTPVPLTRPWFAGLANIRGTLHAVTDFSAFLGSAMTPQDAQARLLLIGIRHGSNAALLVPRVLGLRQAESFSALPASGAGEAAWARSRCADPEGQGWRRLEVAALLGDRRFLDVAA